jgi:hypothetical protein
MLSMICSFTLGVLDRLAPKILWDANQFCGRGFHGANVIFCLITTYSSCVRMNERRRAFVWYGGRDGYQTLQEDWIMNTRISGIGLAMALGLVLAFAGAASAQDTTLHGRVSFDAGGTLIKGSADNDWSHGTLNTIVLPGDSLWADNGGTAELELPGGTFLRLADGSKSDIVGMTTVRGWFGSFYVHRLNRSSGNFVFQTPAATVEVNESSSVRIDVIDEGATTVSVRWGNAMIRTDVGNAVALGQGQRVFVDPGLLPSDPIPFNASDEDSFDTWNRERTDYLVAGSQTPVQSVSYTDSTLGYADLNQYGEWVTVESRQVWRPTVVVDYVPFRQGHWSYVPAYGYTWVGAQPFSYVTSHYGRWRHYPTYGWCWNYDPVWSPAWCATLRYNDYYVWAPLGYDLRPAAYGSAFFSVGGLNFYYGAASYCSTRYLGYGPSYTNPFYPNLGQNIYANDVHIWNINIGTHGNRYSDRMRIPYNDSVRYDRDYNPRRSIRGPEVYGSSRLAASERANRLESHVARERFSTVDRTGMQSVRTAATGGDRRANVRSVRIDSDQRELRSTLERDGRSMRGNDVTSIRGRGNEIEMTRPDGRTERFGPNTSGDRATRSTPGNEDGRITTRSLRSPLGEDRTGNGAGERSAVRTPQSGTDRSPARTGTTPPSVRTPSSTVERTPVRTTSPRSPETGRFENRTTPRATSGERTTVRGTEAPRAPRVSTPTSNSGRTIERTPIRQNNDDRRLIEAPGRFENTPQRDVGAPSRQIQTPPQRTAAPQSRFNSPSQRRLEAPPQRMTPPQRNIETPAPRVSAPAQRYQSPQRNIAPPSRDLSTPSRRVNIPSPRVSAPSPRINQPSASPRFNQPSASPRVSAPSSPRVSSPPDSGRSRGVGNSSGRGNIRGGGR